MNTFFEKWGYPVDMKSLKPKRFNATGIQTIYESEVYREFLDLRGENRTQLMRRDPTKKEIADWDWREDNFQEVKTILSFLSKNLRRAANRGADSQQIEVTLDYVYEVGASQDFFCALTGDELEFTRGGTYWLGKWCNPNSCTIDRIDSSKGYVEGNIQLITWRANCLKQHLNNDEFIVFCKDVAHYNK
jgi:hypothetical protein